MAENNRLIYLEDAVSLLEKDIAESKDALKYGPTGDKNVIRAEINGIRSAITILKQHASHGGTVDAVEVVRCKDCRHCTVTCDGMVCENALPTKRMMDYFIYGSTILARVKPDDFCSHGERREKE